MLLLWRTCFINIYKTVCLYLIFKDWLSNILGKLNKYTTAEATCVAKSSAGTVSGTFEKHVHFFLRKALNYLRHLSTDKGRKYTYTIYVSSEHWDSIILYRPQTEFTVTTTKIEIFII